MTKKLEDRRFYFKKEVKTLSNINQITFIIEKYIIISKKKILIL